MPSTPGRPAGSPAPSRNALSSQVQPERADLGLEPPSLQRLGLAGTQSRCGHDRSLFLRRTIRNPPFPQHTSPESTKAAGPRGSGAVVHDPVVGTAGSCGAGAGAVAGEHLRGTPAVQLHQVSFRAAAVQPGVAEM